MSAEMLPQNGEKQVPWKIIYKIGQSFDIQMENCWMRQLHTLQPEALEYIMAIDPKLWRCTAWTKDPSLPPRYGMYTSNISESTNAMIDGARCHSWLYTIDSILDTMIRRHDNKFQKYKDFKEKNEVVPEVQQHIKKLYDASASFEVLKIDERLGEYKVNRTPINIGADRVSHCINKINRTCTCGKWQDREFPCIDALAYFRNYEKISVNKVLANEVAAYYNSRVLYFLWKTNINPVIISTLEKTQEILPPIDFETNKRQSGRPKKKRYRLNRSKYANPAESKISCQNCGEAGHNRKTCTIRKYFQKLAEQSKLKQEQQTTEEQQTLDNHVVSSIEVDTNLVALIKATDPGFETNIF
jgi:hypothetical protein